MIAPYVPDPFAPSRRPTREVRVGDLGIGGSNPIRIQSMTTTNTLDTKATVDQIQRLADAGCELARVTAPSQREAENLGEIAAELARRRVRIPLVADIHYTPNAALIAAEHVEKIRINPGNYADKKKFEIREYTDTQYAAELERVAERFRPLVRRCRELGRALRIGTNHGSLSDRIMNRYGDTPRGMVESALEFLAVCEGEGFDDVVFSMKSSNPQVAIQAYRLLAAGLATRVSGARPPDAAQPSGARTPLGAPSYPFHLGVTEAGDGEDGRIKSAIGIGALLEDGIGDTIRVSLTEDPVREIPVAQALARRYDARWRTPLEPRPAPEAPFVEDPYAHRRRDTRAVGVGPVTLGDSHEVRVEIDLGPAPVEAEAATRAIERSLAGRREVSCESLLVEASDADGLARAAGFARAARGLECPVSLRVPARLAAAAAQVPRSEGGPARLVVAVEDDSGDLQEAAAAAARADLPVEWSLYGPDLDSGVDATLRASRAAGLSSVLFSAPSGRPVHAVRRLAAALRAGGAGDAPIVLRHASDPTLDEQTAILHAAVDLGAPLCDGIGDAVALSGFGDPGRSVDLAYRILQGARLRTTWTEFISCPSCGRTLFDLEETTARIKARTTHLRGVKIAIMGCIVNGPGEMADADFGYVGSGPGRVNLYVGEQLVERHVPEDEADDRLVELIRKHGRWADPA